MTVMTPDEYRKKHPRCATCKYFVPKYTNGYTGMCDVVKSDKQKTALGDDYAGLIAKIYIPFCRNNEDIIVAALKGDIKDVNIHCAVEQYECSVCGKEYSECSHKKGEVYDSKLCCCELVNPYKVYNWSFVLSSNNRKE